MTTGTEIPAAILMAVEVMRKSFGGTEVEIVGECYRLNSSPDTPAGALGCDITIKIPEHEMKPIKVFFRNSIAEDIAWKPPEYSQMIADQMVFELIRPEFLKIKSRMMIKEAHEDYSKAVMELDPMNQLANGEFEIGGRGFIPFGEEAFVERIKKYPSFAEDWGLKIEERELTWEETVEWVMKNTDVDLENLYIVEEAHKETTPKKKVTMSYKGQMIEIYG
jgi:hypothetical protein